MYSLQTSLIILGMIISGTARSVGVKVLYQLGFDHPLLVALFYLAGQSMALLVYAFSKYCRRGSQGDNNNNTPKREYARLSIQEEDGDIEKQIQEHEDDTCCSITVEEEDASSSSSENEDQSQRQSTTSKRPSLQRQGSQTGLTAESHQAVAWVHCIPWQLKPLIPGLFNLANAALKWASFIYCAASIAEMLMSGLELVLSVVVARMVRKRHIHPWRWAGVAIVAVGLWLVHAADVILEKDQQSAGVSSASPEQLQRDQTIGALLIVGQCITAVGQDMAEELFLQETDFPATLLLGMEGLFGLLFGIPLYLQYAPTPPMETLVSMQQSPWTMVYLFLLTTVFTVTGIFNIMTTGVTSSMTRNMWKNCRTLLVWVLGLVLFYAVGDENLGEEWIMPDSFFILGGFLTMLSGIYVYYKHK
ncbi:Chromosome 2 open reading frame 18 [Seminavis robusta]|uniref:Chromosome 2 open reading frame 18 n=1 Tax=Seminavis robusta TaxID=568900 RepID=A0A9N8DGF6_9STRA|nr:Chromosome 2 open reading frame 18 [Seminavis robusta]|eukprot:Sro75_g041320.1 Chromosome 2 open reading frame 18 (418) ;mRNA; r:82864-84117